MLFLTFNSILLWNYMKCKVTLIVYPLHLVSEITVNQLGFYCSIFTDKIKT